MFKQYGQTTTQNIITILFIAIAAIAVYTAFGNISKQNAGAVTSELGGTDGKTAADILAEEQSDALQAFNDSVYAAAGDNPDPSTIEVVATFAKEVVIGVGEGVYENGKGIVNMVLHPIDTAEGLKDLADFIAENPEDGIKLLYEALIGDDIDRVMSGDPREIGRVIGENLDPTKLVSVVKDLRRAASAADALEDAGDIADAVDDVADVVDRVDDIGDSAGMTAILGRRVDDVEKALMERWYREARDTSDEIVIGRLEDTGAGGDLGMHKLDVRAPDKWTTNVNDAWVQGGIDGNKSFYLGTNPTDSNFFTPPGSEFATTIFKREYDQLIAAGYKQVGDYMRPPGWSP